MKIRLCAMAVVAVMLCAGSAWAVVIYDESDYTPLGGFDADYNSSPPYQEAADFVLGQDNVIQDIHWWGHYGYNTNSVTEPDDFTIRFFLESGGNPLTSPFVELNPTVDRTLVETVGSFNIYAYSVDVSDITLNPGQTYFISIVNNTTGMGLTDNWVWEASERPASVTIWYRTSDSAAWDSFANRTGCSLMLTGTSAPAAVPEPATLTLVGLGGLGILLRRRKSR